MPQGNVFVWVLIGFPLYLLMRGRLTTYLAMATQSGTGAAATTTAGGAPGTATANANIARNTGISISTLNAIPTQAPALQGNTAGNFT